MSSAIPGPTDGDQRLRGERAAGGAEVQDEHERQRRDRANERHGGKAAANARAGQRVHCPAPSHTMHTMTMRLRSAATRGPCLLLGCLPAIAARRRQRPPSRSSRIRRRSPSIRRCASRFGATPVVALSSPADAELRALGALAVDILRQELGANPRVATTAAAATPPRPSSLTLPRRDTSAGTESYRLDVTARGVTITAPRPAGLFYGLQTLRALLEAERARATLAGTRGRRARRAPRRSRIADAPRFSLSRAPPRRRRATSRRSTFVKRYIDLMSRYKLNTFHWHLTDDQGWRIEIKKYPRLTEVGGCRKETQLGRNRNPYVGDSIRYGGFYTQDQIRDVVAYAKARYVTVIPEIEMPGHAKAALAAYPELGCSPGPYEVWTTWGVDPNIFCPKEETFTFLENVLTEVMALFPSTYIHIGGDEAPKTAGSRARSRRR